MGNGIYVATSGSVAQLRHLEVVANNLAHARSAGYKADAVTFRDVTAEPPTAAEVVNGDPSPRAKHFEDVARTHVELAPGEMYQTDNPLDVALTRNAFLRIETADGERLTRAGRLLRASDGALRTVTGDLVLDDRGERIYLPPDRVPSIDTRGNITVSSGAVDGGDGLFIGRLGLAGVDLRGELRKDARGHILPPGQAAPLDPNATVEQGFLEESNVQPVQAMLDLIEVQRTFSALRQAITTYGEIDDRIIQLA